MAADKNIGGHVETEHIDRSAFLLKWSSIMLRLFSVFRAAPLAAITFALSPPGFAAAPAVGCQGNASCTLYFVVLKRQPSIDLDRAAVSVLAEQLERSFGGTVRSRYEKIFPGVTVELSEDAASRVAQLPNVKYVEKDAVGGIVATQSNPPWGLDRIDQFSDTLNSSYTYTRTASGVHAYVLDTGIRATHNEFTGRIGGGTTFVSDGNGTNDCNGHGTHVSGTIGGTTYGVAKSVTIHPVRIVDCGGSGYSSQAADGLEWVISNAAPPAVVNMSVRYSPSQALDDAVASAVSDGIVVVVAAGNDYSDACNYSPARAPEAITVGAINSSTTVASFSNDGECVDVFAPGVGVLSAWNTSNTATATLDGTSMASPHVVGVVALFIDQVPTTSVTDAINNVISKTTQNTVASTNGEPNQLIYSLDKSTGIKAVYRYWNEPGTDHHYTTNWTDLQAGLGSNWKLESVQGYVHSGSGSDRLPIYRWWNASYADHMITTNVNEQPSGYVYDSIIGYAPPTSSSTKNFYRWWNATTKDHFFTSNPNETSSGYVSEGICCQLLNNR